MAKLSPRHAVIDKSQCVACGSCMDICPRGAITVWHGSVAVVDEALCVGCGRCAKECPASIITIQPRVITPEQEVGQHEKE